MSWQQLRTTGAKVLFRKSRRGVKSALLMTCCHCVTISEEWGALIDWVLLFRLHHERFVS
jgi:hypothetical protein